MRDSTSVASLLHLKCPNRKLSQVAALLTAIVSACGSPTKPPIAKTAPQHPQAAPPVAPVAPPAPLANKIRPSAPQAGIEVHGHVTDVGGHPVAGAVVAANRGTYDSHPGPVTRTGADGGFVVTLPEGRWAFTATSDAGVGAYREPARIATGDDVSLVLGDEGFTLSGHVAWTGELPKDSVIVATRSSPYEGDLFVTLPGADGSYKLRLPSAPGYSVNIFGSGVVSMTVSIRKMVDQIADLQAAPLAPPPAVVVDWVKQSAAALKTVEAGHGLDDMAQLDPIIGDARIVALGEATHGTREFFQMKHRFLEYLVEKHGFRLFAIESNLTEARRVNDYVLHGKGTASEALAGMYFWIYDTEEVLAMIEWMRAYNLDPSHKTKVQFFGMDMQFTRVAWPHVRTYLERVDPAYAKSLPAELGAFAADRFTDGWYKLPAEQRVELQNVLDGIVGRMDAKTRSYVKASSAEEWRAAREDARLVAQAASMTDPRRSGSHNVRDEAMAENVEWILDHEGKNSKLVLWAHNGHVGLEMPPYASPNMGGSLRKKYGDKYLVLGFVFSEGGFQARGTVDAPRGTGVQSFVVGTPPDTYASAAFTRAGEDLCVLDLRKAPAGPVADWFRAPHLVRDIGAVFSGEDNMAEPESLSQRYDALIFVRKTTAARPNPTGHRDR